MTTEPTLANQDKTDWFAAIWPTGPEPRTREFSMTITLADAQKLAAKVPAPAGVDEEHVAVVRSVLGMAMPGLSITQSSRPREHLPGEDPTAEVTDWQLMMSLMGTPFLDIRSISGVGYFRADLRSVLGEVVDNLIEETDGDPLFTQLVNGTWFTLDRDQVDTLSRHFSSLRPRKQATREQKLAAAWATTEVTKVGDFYHVVQELSQFSRRIVDDTYDHSTEGKLAALEAMTSMSWLREDARVAQDYWVTAPGIYEARLDLAHFLEAALSTNPLDGTTVNATLVQKSVPTATFAVPTGCQLVPDALIQDRPELG